MVPDYNEYVKTSLNDYDTYFMDQPGGADAERRATHEEFFHYHVVLSDKQTCNSVAYRANKVPHVYRLLSCLTMGLEGSETIGL
jgi:hypothetical protein